MSLPRRKLHVVFVVDPGLLWLGSTQMRSEQLGQMLADVIGPEFSYSVSARPRGRGLWLPWALTRKRGSILFFTKSAAQRLEQKVLDVLHTRGHVTCVDYVDSDLRKCATLRPTFHVAASIWAMGELNRLLSGTDAPGQCALLHHAADRRLLNFRPKPLKAARPVYLGLPANAVWSDRIAEAVTMLDASGAAEMEQSLPRLPEFNLHYSVRPPAASSGDAVIAKPFTKGFTAAYCASVVVTSTAEFDAVALLGDDYPYLVQKPDDEDEILACLNRATTGFGSDEWHYARQKVAALKAVCSPETIAEQFTTMLSRV